ncbi:DNA-binding transcriptional regulator of glucitol operon [Nakamurella sp. UYEF19]|uniref:hypothetical protein n=1 Tax=Nakamurella sp. UYEF19 TaxID=1756392 RepID=UPI00339555BF
MYRKFLRPGWIFGHLMVVVALLVCLRLGLWQWHRTEHGGTVQNLGYTVLWPIFGAAFVYMWFRFLQLEILKDAEDDAELTAMAAGDPTSDGADPAVTASGPGDPAAGTDSPQPTSAVRLPTFDPAEPAEADFPSFDVLSKTTAEAIGDARSIEAVADSASESTSGAVAAGTVVPPRNASRGITVAVSTVGDDDEDDDPELAAYNRALAALAAKDHRRAR